MRCTCLPEGGGTYASSMTGREAKVRGRLSPGRKENGKGKEKEGNEEGGNILTELMKVRSNRK